MFPAMKTTAVMLAFALAATCSAEEGRDNLRHLDVRRELLDCDYPSCGCNPDVCGDSMCGSYPYYYSEYNTMCLNGETICVSDSDFSSNCQNGATCGRCRPNGDGPCYGCGDNDFCFSATANLFVRGKGLVAMQDAKVGDMVRTIPDDNFEPLYAFGHRDKEQEATFLKITMDSNSLEVTGAHLVYLAGKTRPVRADSIKVGDQLQAANGSHTVVKEIGSVVTAGLYAPLVPTGRLWVDGVLASSYIALQEEDNEYFSTLNGLLKIPHDVIAHLYLSPFRVVCMGMTDKPCHVMNSNGIPLYIAWGMDTIHMVHHSTKSYVQPLFILITSVLLSGFVIVEGLFGARMGPLIVFSLAMAFAFSCKGKNTKTVES
jgi:Hint module